MVEYRGYGLSEGSPSEQGLYVDAQSAVEYIMQRSDVDPTKLILFGRSLGNNTAIFRFYNETENKNTSVDTYNLI